MRGCRKRKMRHAVSRARHSALAFVYSSVSAIAATVRLLILQSDDVLVVETLTPVYTRKRWL